MKSFLYTQLIFICLGTVAVTEAVQHKRSVAVSITNPVHAASIYLPTIAHTLLSVRSNS